MTDTKLTIDLQDQRTVSPIKPSLHSDAALALANLAFMGMRHEYLKSRTMARPSLLRWFDCKPRRSETGAVGFVLKEKYKWYDDGWRKSKSRQLEASIRRGLVWALGLIGEWSEAQKERASISDMKKLDYKKCLAIMGDNPAEEEVAVFEGVTVKQAYCMYDMLKGRSVERVSSIYGKAAVNSLIGRPDNLLLVERRKILMQTLRETAAKRDADLSELQRRYNTDPRILAINAEYDKKKAEVKAAADEKIATIARELNELGGCMQVREAK